MVCHSVWSVRRETRFSSRWRWLLLLGHFLSGTVAQNVSYIITSLTLIMLCSVIGVIGGNFTLRDREALEAVCLDAVSLGTPDPQWCDHSCCDDINTLGMQSAIQGTNNSSSITSGVHLIGDGNRPCYTPRLAMHKKCLRGRPSGWAVKLCLLRFHFGRVSFKTLMHVSFFFGYVL